MQDIPRHVHDIAFSGISRQREQVFFLQIGAADGKRLDPIHSFVQRYRWQGILVEPLADLFELLKATYGNRDDLILENVAITEKDETRHISRVPLEDVGRQGVPDWAFAASTLVPEKTRFSADNSPPPLHEALNSAVVREEVQCLSLASLLARHDVKNIDVLQIDAEGYDARILMQLDMSVFRPSVINMEWHWLTDTEKREISTHLKGHGYSMYESHMDMMATAVPVEQLVIESALPSPTSVPTFFPGISGLVCQTDINDADGACAEQPSTFAIVRDRQMTSPVSVGPEMYNFLAQIDGQRSYIEIAQATELSVEQLMSWGRQLQTLYVLD
ncbi:MAG: FkbM family methyltransferase [Gammaproteobacteria bacterium]